jgi:hypothetical protein
MNPRRLAVASLVLTACAGGPVPVLWIDSRVLDENPDDRSPEIGSFDRIEDACAFWDLTCYETDDTERVLTIILSTHGALLAAASTTAV